MLVSDPDLKTALVVHQTLKFGEYIWNDNGIPAGRIRIIVDRKNQLISIIRAGHEIGTAVILYGTESKPTPTGVLHILAKYQEHRSSLYDTDMPFTLRLTDDGISIHAVPVVERMVTHGCIGVPLEFAAKLFEAAQIDDPVEIS